MNHTEYRVDRGLYPFAASRAVFERIVRESSTGGPKNAVPNNTVPPNLGPPNLGPKNLGPKNLLDTIGTTVLGGSSSRPVDPARTKIRYFTVQRITNDFKRLAADLARARTRGGDTPIPVAIPDVVSPADDALLAPLLRRGVITVETRVTAGTTPRAQWDGGASTILDPLRSNNPWLAVWRFENSGVDLCGCPIEAQDAVALAYVNLGEPGPAHNILDAALRSCRHPKLLYAQAMIYLRYLPKEDRRPEVAATLLDEAIANLGLIAGERERSREFALLLNAKALIQARDADVEGALALMEQGSGILDDEHTDDTEARAIFRLNIGRLLLEETRAADAVPWLEAATELEPDFVDNWVHLGNALVEIGETSRALGILRSRLVDENDRNVRVLRARVLHETGDAQGCLRELETVWDEDPADAQIAVNLSVYLGELGRYGDALSIVAEAAKFDPPVDKLIDLELLAIQYESLAMAGPERECIRFAHRELLKLSTKYVGNSLILANLAEAERELG